MIIRAYIAKVEAYQRKESAGGGYSAIVVIKKLEHNTLKEGEQIERVQLGKYDDQSIAFQAAFEVVEKFAGDRHFSVAHYSSNKWRKDYTIWENVPSKSVKLV